MARTIGTVKSISGKAAVKTLNDQLHVLKVGEALHENEMVYALGADSKVTLTLEGGRELTLNGYDEILLDKSVFATLEEGEALDLKALQQALAEGEANLEETAAGQEVVGEANAGAEYADRNDARGNPNSYLTGTENGALGVTFDALQNENFAPEAFDDSGSAVEEGSGDDYDAPVVATGNVLGNDTDDLLPNPPSDLDVTAVTSNNTSNPTNFVGGFFVIEGQYGTLVLNSETGEYTYTVDESNTTVDTMNIGDSVQESFSYIVNDGALEDSAVLTITIAGSNDAPIATGEGGYTLNVDSDAALTNISSSPTEGAAVKFIVATQAGETVTFNWQFNAGDYLPYNDFAFVGVDNGNLVLLSNVATVGNYGSSGMQTYSITFSEAGAHTITFGVSDYGDTGVDSSLNISNMTGGNLLGVETLGSVGATGSTYFLTTAGANVSQLNAFLDTDMTIGGLINSMEGNEADTAVAAEGNVLDNDTDVDNPHEQLSVVSVNGESVPQSEGVLTYQGMYGVLEMDAKGNFTYTPYDAESETKGASAVDALNVGDTLQETFTYMISDNEEGGAKTDTAVLLVTITGTNDAPVATADYGTSYEGNESDDAIPAVGNVLGGDYDVDNTTLSVISVNGQNVSAGGSLSIAGAFGTLVIASDGSYVYTPYSPESEHENAGLVDALNEGETLTESFAYTVSDNESGGAKTDSATLTITIEGTNDAPVAVGDRNYVKEAGYHQHPSTAEGNVITDPESGDSDVDNESLWVVGVQKVSGQGGHGGEGEENDSGHSGGQGGHGGEGEDGHNGSEGGYGPGGPHAPTGYDFLVNGKYGVLFMWENGDYVYMLKNGKEQVDSLNEGDRVSETFSYTITDGDKYATAELKISIQGTNDAPVANEDKVEISEDDLQPNWFWHPALTIDALGNDTDVDSDDNPSNFKLLSVSVEGGIENGIAWIDQNTDTIKYIPNWWGNQSLNESDTKNVTLNYTMSDDSGVTSTSTVTITIMGENDHPVAVLDFASGDENHIFVMNVLANDWDVDSGDNPSNFQLVALNYSGPGTVSIVGNQLQFAPGTAFDYLNVGEKATVNIWYKMSDDSGAQSNWTLATLKLLGSNDGPVAIDDFTKASFETFDINLENGNWDGVTISAIGGNISINPGNGKLGVYKGPGDSHLVDNKGTDEAVKFEFDGKLQHVEVELSNFNSVGLHNDKALWTVLLDGSIVASGEFIAHANASTLIIDTGNLVFDTLIVATPTGGSFDDFYINGIQGNGLVINSDLTLTENNTLLIPESYMLNNDSDVDNDILNIVDIDTNGTIGEVKIDADGNVTYDPAGRFEHLSAGEIATDTFTYTLSDGSLTDTASVTVNIIGISNPEDSSSNLNCCDLLLGYDGEDGYDTVTLASSLGNNINFEWLGNIENIENINLQGGGKTLSNITPENVMDITDNDNILKISGEADDSLNLSGFTLDAATSANLEGYNAYTGTFGGTEVTLHIDEDITNINIIP